MASPRTVAAVSVLAIVVIASFLTYQFYLAPRASSCQSLAAGTITNSTAAKTSFGTVTEYKLPGQDRWPNAITADVDGSVWFAEQEVPGVAHLFPNNGTLVEYAWPGYPVPKLPDCIPTVSASAIAIWNGRVWAADEFGDSIVGVNPRDGTSTALNTSGKADFPYWLAVAPDGALWFTSDNTPARLGKIQSDLSIGIIDLSGLGSDEPLQLKFVNASLAYIATINLSTNATTHSCECNGHIYSFDPANVSSVIAPVRVGGAYHLQLPTSVTYLKGGIWVAQHGGASVVNYDLHTRNWTVYPTSIVGWTDTTLPLSIEASGDRVWFNEHYANKIALLDPGAGTLTEYSESNPPAASTSGIQNDLSIAASPDGLWFTSMSGNYVGFVNASEDPGFHAAVKGPNAAGLLAGEGSNFTVRITGTWSAPMKVNVSDSETPASVPKSIQLVPSTLTIQPGASPYDLNVKFVIGQTVPPGRYTVAVTITNGNVQQTAYYFLVVR